jgi:hypothetical protein
MHQLQTRHLALLDIIAMRALLVKQLLLCVESIVQALQPLLIDGATAAVNGGLLAAASAA